MLVREDFKSAYDNHELQAWVLLSCLCEGLPKELNLVLKRKWLSVVTEDHLSDVFKLDEENVLLG